MDIVKRLRHTEEETATIGKELVYLQVPVNPDGPEAANEIERLRDEVHFDVHTINALSENNDLLEAENKWLRDALRWALPYVKTDKRVNDIVRAALKEGK